MQKSIRWSQQKEVTQQKQNTFQAGGQKCLPASLKQDKALPLDTLTRWEYKHLWYIQYMKG